MSADNKQLPDDFSFLNLPDEELKNYSPPTGEVAPLKIEAPVVEATPVEVVAEEGAEEDAPTDSPAAQETGEEAPASAEGDAAGGDAAKAPVVEVKPEAKTEDKKEEVVDKPKAEEPGAVDYKQAYEKILAPFKANGKDIQVKDVDEAITLMQMGANYNKKMAALKPNLMLLKLLENNGLLDESKLSYLIDLDKKDPAAINKLIKESGLDPMDLDAAKAEGYKPPVRKVDEREVELDTVLDEIQSTPSYERTIEIVGKGWDKPSRQVISESPQILKLINQHVAAGIYDLVASEMERERLFGRLAGMSDIEAYRQVGDAMASRGAFNSLGRQEEKKEPEKVIVTPKPAKEDDEATKDKKRAAGPVKAATVAAPVQDFNPLSLSDEEFMRVMASKR